MQRYQPSSIDYACRPRLESRLTQGGLAWPGDMVIRRWASHLISLLMPAFSLLPSTSSHLKPVQVAPYTHNPCHHPGKPDSEGTMSWVRGFGGVLEPAHCRRTSATSELCTLSGWLLLRSLLVVCATAHPFHSTRRGLSQRSGLFPSRPRSLSPAISLPRYNPTAFRFG